MNLQDKAIDNKIRAALRSADAKKKLGVVAAVTGISGGVGKLREIMNGADDLSAMDRVMLGVHIKIG